MRKVLYISLRQLPPRLVRVLLVIKIVNLNNIIASPQKLPFFKIGFRNYHEAAPISQSCSTKLFSTTERLPQSGYAPNLFQSGSSKLFSKAAPESCSAKLLPKAAPKSCVAKLVPKAAPQSCGFSKLLIGAAAQSCSSKLLLLPKAAPQSCSTKLFHKATPQSCSAPNNCSPKLLKLFPKIVAENCFPKLLSKATPQSCHSPKIVRQCCCKAAKLLPTVVPQS